MDKNKLAEKFRLLRKRSGLNQDILADKSGVSIGVVKAIESTGGNPTLDNLGLLLGVLNTTFTKFFSEIENEVVSSNDSVKPIMAELKDIKAKLDQKTGPSLDPQKEKLIRLISGLNDKQTARAIKLVNTMLSKPSLDKDEDGSGNL